MEEENTEVAEQENEEVVDDNAEVNTEAEVETTEGEEEVVLEDWQKSDEDEEIDPDKPVKFLKAKKALKGRIAEVSDENAALKAQLEALKRKPAETGTETPTKRPDSLDFDTDEEYHAALDKYNDDRALARYEELEATKSQSRAVRAAKEKLEADVDQHFERAAKLIETSGIKPEIYQASDATVRAAVEAISPEKGDLIVDHLISTIGEGSEKVTFFLGRNKAALGEFQALLASDPTGMKAAIYLGQQKERLTNPAKPRSNAQSPAPKVNGGKSNAGNPVSMKKEFDALMKKDKVNEAFNLRRDARKNKIDTSKW